MESSHWNHEADTAALYLWLYNNTAGTLGHHQIPGLFNLESFEKTSVQIFNLRNTKMAFALKRS